MNRKIFYFYPQLRCKILCKFESIQEEGILKEKIFLIIDKHKFTF